MHFIHWIGSSFFQAKLETKALKAKRPGFTDERYNETSYYHEPENSKLQLHIARVVKGRFALWPLFDFV